MSQMYTIGLQVGKNVAIKVDALVASEEAQQNFRVDTTKKLNDGTTVYKWYAEWATWNYPIQAKLVELLKEFKNSDDEDDAYKLTAVGDDGGYDNMSNDKGWDLFTELGNSSGVVFPDEFSDDNDVVEKIRNAALKCVPQKAADVMGELTFDEHADTWHMFEDLCGRYASENADFRKGMDAVLAIILKHNLSEIADMIV